MTEKELADLNELISTIKAAEERFDATIAEYAGTEVEDLWDEATVMTAETMREAGWAPASDHEFLWTRVLH